MSTHAGRTVDQSEADTNVPAGTPDAVQGRLDVGEYVHSTPVVEALGVDFHDWLEERYGARSIIKAMGAS